MTLYGESYQNSRAFDDMNNVYVTTGVEIANGGKRKWISLNLVKDIPIKGRIYFEGVDSSATKLTLLQIYFAVSNQGYFNVQFRDISLINK